MTNYHISFFRTEPSFSRRGDGASEWGFGRRCQEHFAVLRGAMSRIPNRDEIYEMLEDAFELATGEPKIVTDLELDLSPAQSGPAGPNWSCSLDSKPQYRRFLPEVYDAVRDEFPVIKFA